MYVNHMLSYLQNLREKPWRYEPKEQKQEKTYPPPKKATVCVGVGGVLHWNGCYSTLRPKQRSVEGEKGEGREWRGVGGEGEDLVSHAGGCQGSLHKKACISFPHLPLAVSLSLSN